MEEAEEKANEIRENITRLKRKYDDEFLVIEDKHNKN